MRGGQRHGSIGKFVEPYPKPIRKSKRGVVPQGMMPLSLHRTHLPVGSNEPTYCGYSTTSYITVIMAIIELLLHKRIYNVAKW